MTPLIIACQRGYKNIVREILSYPDVNVNVVDKMGTTPLYIECQDGNKDIVQKLLSLKNLDITIMPKNKGIITSVVEGEDKEEIISMLQNRANRDLPGACESDEVEKVNRLLNIVGDLEPERLGKLYNISTKRLAEVMTKRFSTQILTQVLQYIKDVDARDSIINKIFDKKDILNKVGEVNREVLKYKISKELEEACREPNDCDVQKLLNTGIDVRESEAYMNAAVLAGSNTIINILKKKGARAATVAIEKTSVPVVHENVVSKRVKQNKNALLEAIEEGNLTIVKKLLKSVSANETDGNGKSLLMYAIERGQVDTVKFLISKGANKKAEDNSNKSVLMYALAKGEIMSFVIEEIIDEANLRLVDKDAKNLLMYACQGGYMPAVKKLVDKLLKLDIGLDNTDAKGWTAAGIAFSRGDTRMTEYLMRKGAVEAGRIPNKNGFYELKGKIDQGILIPKVEKRRKGKYKL